MGHGVRPSSQKWLVLKILVMDKREMSTSKNDEEFLPASEEHTFHLLCKTRLGSEFSRVRVLTSSPPPP